MIGARQQTHDDLRFESSDGKVVLTFSRDRGRLQVEIGGEWLWLSPFEADRLQLWLEKTDQ